MQDISPDQVGPTDERYWAWPLGDDYDCETCGFTWNEATLDLDWDEDGTWMFSYQAGCYGGDSVTSRDEDAREHLESMFRALSAYPEWTATNEQEARNLLNQ